MKKLFSNSMKSLAIILATGLAGVFTSCNDDVIPENRYTFTGETIASYLEKDEEYSRFCEVLNKTRIGSDGAGTLLKTLSTYGSYTCFAPTNAAIDSFIAKQRREYKGSLEYEAFVDSLSIEIAKNHVVERAYLTTDLKAGPFPQTTLNNRYITVEFEYPEGEDRFFTVLSESRVIVPDVQCENGIVNIIDNVFSPSNEVICDLIGLHEEFSIFSEALIKTAWNEKLLDYEIDPDYETTYAAKTSVKHSLYETNNFNGLPYAPTKLQKYTIFVETDSLFNANGIHNLDDLIKLANKWYGSDYYDEVDYENFDSPNNPLNRFIAYHILDCGIVPGALVMGDDYKNKAHGFEAKNHFKPSKNRTEYYETKLNKMLKVTLVGNDDKNGEYTSKLLINYAQDYGQKATNKTMRDHLNVPVDPLWSDTQMRKGLSEFDGDALNGVIQVIDGILIYNEEEMGGNVLNERIRINSTSLFPELISNDIRWGQMPAEYTSKMGYIIPDGYLKKVQLNNVETKIIITVPHPSDDTGTDWAVLLGDEFIATCTYDFSVKIPPVPAGTYEVRFGFSSSSARGIVQFYFDNEITGIPIDMITVGNESSGIWSDDSEYTSEQIDMNDRGIRNQGWMRGPESMKLSNTTNMRQSKNCYRRIVTTATLNGGGDHEMRFKYVGGSSQYRECSFDYLELVPKSVLSDVNKPEDKD